MNDSVLYILVQVRFRVEHHWIGALQRDADCLRVETLPVDASNEAVCGLLAVVVDEGGSLGGLLWRRLVVGKHEVVVHMLEDLLVLLHIFVVILTYNMKAALVVQLFVQACAQRHLRSGSILGLLSEHDSAGARSLVRHDIAADYDGFGFSLVIAHRF